jgi:hypothetical protein
LQVGIYLNTIRYRSPWFILDPCLKRWRSKPPASTL